MTVMIQWCLMTVFPSCQLDCQTLERLMIEANLIKDTWIVKQFRWLYPLNDGALKMFVFFFVNKTEHEETYYSV